jgi:hypothetical protein
MKEEAGCSPRSIDQYKNITITMQKQKRPFYIIAHNPNTIEEAREFLDLGVNGLEPDIVHANGKFYVSHLPHVSYDGVPTVQEYLQQLKDLLLEKKYNLALLIWDIKDTDFDPNQFIALVKENFTGEPFDGVAMLMTHSDDHAFINRYQGKYANIGVGLDESNVAPAELEKIFIGGGQKNFTYADGITTFLNKPGVFKSITDAQHCRNQHEPDSFKFIYTWVLSLEGALRKYLDTYIDGIMVDTGAVKKLKELIGAEPYSNAYTLAGNGYNPFAASPLPKYLLEIKTADAFMAGTDARLRFTLTGSTGQSLTGLPYHSSAAGALEKGSITYTALEGADLGQVDSITIEALTDGIGSGWLPEYIAVESKLLREKIRFRFNADRPEWISKKTGPVTVRRE